MLPDELGAAIQNGCAAGDVTLIAGKLAKGMWRSYYSNFVGGVRQLHPRVTALVAKRRNWHAKVAIRLEGTDPIAALVGSSNLTGPAFAEPYGHWNYECDALVWIDGDSNLTSYFRGLFRDFKDERVSRMDLILDPAVDQPDEGAQLRHLLAQIHAAEGLQPYE